MQKILLNILNKKINNNNKLLPLNSRKDDVGKTKYYPPISKEWKNSIYIYNHKFLTYLPVFDFSIKHLIKNYFNSYLNHNFYNTKFISNKNRRLSMNKIYISKAEVKHTNNNAILTVYIFNRQRIVLLKKIKKYRNIFLSFLNYYFFKLNNKSFFKKNLQEITIRNLNNKLKISSKLNNKILFRNKIFKFNTKFNKNKKLNKNLTIYLIWNIKKDLLKKEKLLYKDNIIKIISQLRNLKIKINLNKYKLEEIFLYKLSNLISKYFNKKLIFNIVSIKAFILNSDLFTEILGLKLKKKDIKLIRRINNILKKANLPVVNSIKEKGFLSKTVNLNFLENKIKNTSLVYSIKNTNIYGILNKIYYNIVLNKNINYSEIYNIIFNNINYKNMGGIRLEVKGRLTKRYRADRTLLKVRWKGGLKNIDSSYKRLSTVSIRGYKNSNSEYSIYTSKRRIGAFAVKGWIAGK